MGMGLTVRYICPHKKQLKCTHKSGRNPPDPKSEFFNAQRKQIIGSSHDDELPYSGVSPHEGQKPHNEVV